MTGRRTETGPQNNNPHRASGQEDARSQGCLNTNHPWLAVPTTTPPLPALRRVSQIAQGSTRRSLAPRNATGPGYTELMTDKPAPTEVENLSVSDCLALLRGVSLGRLAVWDQDHPDIFPINYAVDHGTIVFRTGQGSKLTALLGAFPVAMEADSVDANTGIVWSVVIKGTAALLTSTDEVLDTFALNLFPWHAGPKENFIRITPTAVSGRRFRVTNPARWWTAQSAAIQSATE